MTAKNGVSELYFESSFTNRNTSNQKQCRDVESSRKATESSASRIFRKKESSEQSEATVNANTDTETHP